MGKEIVGSFAYIRSTRDVDEVLFILRRTPPYAGHWSIPGGAVKNNETREAAVAREVGEEINAKIDIGRYLGYVKFPGDFDTSYHFTGHVFEASYVSGDLRPQESEVAEIAWMKEDSIPYKKVAKPVAEFYRKMRATPLGEIVKVDLNGRRN